MNNRVNLKKLIEVCFHNRTNIFVHSTNDKYDKFVEIIQHYLPDFKEAYQDMYTPDIKNTVLENPNDNSSYGVIFNFSKEYIIALDSYNNKDICSNQYMLGSFSKDKDKCLKISYEYFLSALNSSLITNIDNNLIKEKIYLTHQIDVYEKDNKLRKVDN